MQRVYAVGVPPENKICFFRDLVNVAVLPAVGTSYQLCERPYTKHPLYRKSLSCIMSRWGRPGWVGFLVMRTKRYSYSGSFSDTYNIYFGNSALLPTIRAAPANYPPSEVWTVDEGRGDVTIDDVRDFVVEFMISDSAVRCVPSGHL